MGLVIDLDVDEDKVVDMVQVPRMWFGMMFGLMLRIMRFRIALCALDQDVLAVEKYINDRLIRYSAISWSASRLLSSLASAKTILREKLD